jgi:hypothetical protein
MRVPEALGVDTAEDLLPYDLDSAVREQRVGRAQIPLQQIRIRYSTKWRVLPRLTPDGRSGQWARRDRSVEGDRCREALLIVRFEPFGLVQETT